MSWDTGEGGAWTAGLARNTRALTAKPTTPSRLLSFTVPSPPGASNGTHTTLLGAGQLLTATSFHLGARCGSSAGAWWCKACNKLQAQMHQPGPQLQRQCRGRRPPRRACSLRDRAWQMGIAPCAPPGAHRSASGLVQPQGSHSPGLAKSWTFQVRDTQGVRESSATRAHARLAASGERVGLAAGAGGSVLRGARLDAHTNPTILRSLHTHAHVAAARAARPCLSFSCPDLWCRASAARASLCSPTQTALCCTPPWELHSRARPLEGPAGLLRGTHRPQQGRWPPATMAAGTRPSVTACTTPPACIAQLARVLLLAASPPAQRRLSAAPRAPPVKSTWACPACCASPALLTNAEPHSGGQRGAGGAGAGPDMWMGRDHGLARAAVGPGCSLGERTQTAPLQYVQACAWRGAGRGRRRGPSRRLGRRGQGRGPGGRALGAGARAPTHWGHARVWV